MDFVLAAALQQRILGCAIEFVEPVAGRAARLLEAADAWVGDKVRRASSGVDGRRLLELYSRDSDNFATLSMVKTLL